MSNDWFDQLRPASFRGVRFGVLTAEGVFGRRAQVHEYPFRDTPWVEDLGRATRRISFTGFLISDSQVYAGGSAIDQQQALIAAAETAGPGALVHPTLGDLTLAGVTVTPVSRVEGRYIEFQLTGYEAGERIFPAASPSTQSAVSAAATTADAGAGSDFSDAVTPGLAIGAMAAQQVQGAIAGWTAQIQDLTADATSLSRLASDLPGAFGRFFNGANLGGFGQGLSSIYSASTTVADLAVVATGERAAILSNATGLTALAGNLGLGASSISPAQLATAAQALIAAFAGAPADPADAVRCLSALAGFASSVSPSTLASAVGDLMRRGAVTALARTGATYQPASYDDANAVRGLITGLLDAEIQIAGDQGADETFNALRALRVAVVQDLAARGANLAPIRTFTLPDSLPVIVLAQRLYRDPSRADGLLTQLGLACPHPLFAPASFRALAA